MSGVLGLADVVDCLQEVAVGQLDDVGLGDGSHIVLAVLAGVLEGSAGDALTALSGLDL